jgi:uncharacterized Zn-binding protein involved in type VI secretion
MTSHGGRIITGSHTRTIKGRPVARIGDMCTCPVHGKTIITVVLPIMPQTDGRYTAHSGALTKCGAMILPAAHQDTQGPRQ